MKKFNTNNGNITGNPAKALLTATLMTITDDADNVEATNKKR